MPTFASSAASSSSCVLEVGSELDRDLDMYFQTSAPDTLGPIVYLDSNARVALRRHLERFANDASVAPAADPATEARVTMLQEQITRLQQDLASARRSASQAEDRFAEALKTISDEDGDESTDDILERVAAEAGVNFSVEKEFTATVMLEVTITGTRKRGLPETEEIEQLDFSVNVGTGYRVDDIDDLDVDTYSVYRVESVEEA